MIRDLDSGKMTSTIGSSMPIGSVNQGSSIEPFSLQQDPFYWQKKRAELLRQRSTPALNSKNEFSSRPKYIRDMFQPEQEDESPGMMSRLGDYINGYMDYVNPLGINPISNAYEMAKTTVDKGPVEVAKAMYDSAQQFGSGALEFAYGMPAGIARGFGKTWTRTPEYEQSLIEDARKVYPNLSEDELKRKALMFDLAVPLAEITGYDSGGKVQGVKNANTAEERR